MTSNTDNKDNIVDFKQRSKNNNIKKKQMT